MNGNVIYLGVRAGVGIFHFFYIIFLYDYLHKSQKISHLAHKIENNYEV